MNELRNPWQWPPGHVAIDGEGRSWTAIGASTADCALVDVVAQRPAAISERRVAWGPAAMPGRCRPPHRHERRSDQAVFSERESVGARHDDMVEHAGIDQSQRLLERARQQLVGLARVRPATRVIMY